MDFCCDAFMKNELFLNKVVVKPSSIHGYGVFAEKEIVPGELIEECHTLLTNGEDDVLQNYYFKTENKSGIPLGFGCIYNHSDDPNAEYIYIPEEHLMLFKAIKLIQKGEEICTSYGNNWFKQRSLRKKKISKWTKWSKKFDSFPLRVFLAIVGIVLAVQLAKYLSLS